MQALQAVSFCEDIREDHGKSNKLEQIVEKTKENVCNKFWTCKLLVLDLFAGDIASS